MKKYTPHLLIYFLLFFGHFAKSNSVKKVTLSNGLKVYLLTDSSLPYTQYNLVVPAGSARDPENLKGISSFTAQMLYRGTQKYSSDELIQKMEDLGTQLSITTNKDYSMFSADTLAWNHDQLLSLFSEIITQPSFLEKEILWMKNQFTSRITKWPESPSSFANKIVFERTFKTPEYRHEDIGYLNTIKNFTQEAIKKHYSYYFAPQHSILGVTGQYPDDIIKKLEAHFSVWKKTLFITEQTKKPKRHFWSSLFNKKSLKENETQKKPSNDQINLLIVHKPGAFQSEIRISQPLVPRTSPDYLLVYLANIILGNAGLDSRLFNEVREKHGLTYSIRSQIIPLMREGILNILSPTRLEVTREAMDRILNVLEIFYNKGVTEEELIKAKNSYKTRLLKNNETPAARLLRRILLNYLGLPYDLDQVNRHLNKVKLKEVNQVIRKYYSLKNIQFIIFSDFQAIQSQFTNIPHMEVKDFNHFL